MAYPAFKEPGWRDDCGRTSVSTGEATSGWINFDRRCKTGASRRAGRCAPADMAGEATMISPMSFSASSSKDGPGTHDLTFPPCRRNRPCRRRHGRSMILPFEPFLPDLPPSAAHNTTQCPVAPGCKDNPGKPAATVQKPWPWCWSTPRASVKSPVLPSSRIPWSCPPSRRRPSRRARRDWNALIASLDRPQFAPLPGVVAHGRIGAERDDLEPVLDLDGKRTGPVHRAASRLVFQRLPVLASRARRYDWPK